MASIHTTRAVYRQREALSRFLLLCMTSVLVAGGCATHGTNSADRSSVVSYTESPLDLVNRAPASMSLPPDSDTLIDPLTLRAKADYHFALAETYSLEGNSVRAVEEYRMVLLYDHDSAEVRVRLAQEYVKQGLMGDAVKAARAAAELAPENTDVQLLLAGLYSSLRLYKEAQLLYLAVLKREPDNFDAAMYIGALAAEQKNFPEAISRFTQLAAQSKHPNAHVAHYYLGRVYLESGTQKDTDLALKAFQSALKLKPGFADAALALASVFDSKGQGRKAELLLREYQDNHGPNPAVAEVLGPLFLRQENHALALEQYKILESHDSGDFNSRMKVAFILIQLERYKEAAQRLEALVSEIPSADKVRFYLGAVYEELKDYAAAIPHFLEIDLSSSFYVDSRLHVAQLFVLLSERERAVKMLEESIQSKPDADQFYTMLANQYEELGQMDRALATLEKAAKRFQQSAPVQFYLGYFYDRSGYVEKTVEQMQKVIALDEDHVQALNYLAYLFAERGIELEKAESLARKAVRLKGDDGYILDTLGWVLFKKGRVAEAVRTLESALKLQPNEAIIAEHLGDAYARFQMPERAKVAYTQALKLVEKQERKAILLEAQKGKLSEDTPGNSTKSISTVSARALREKMSNLDRQADQALERVPAAVSNEDTESLPK